MKKILLLILLFYSFLGFGQEYAIWFSNGTKEVTGQRFYNYYVRVTTSPRGVFHTPTGIHKVVRPSVSTRVHEMHRTSGNVVRYCISSDNRIYFNKYEYSAGGHETIIRDFSCTVKKITKIPSELNTFAYLGIYLPYYVQPLDGARSKNDLLFKTKENTFTADNIVKIPEVIWKYNYDNKGFKDFPESIKHNFPMKSTVGKILKDENIQVNKTLKIKAVLDNSRLIMNDTGTLKLPVIFSDIFSFNILAAPPELSSIKPVKTTCNYSIDGGFTLNLKRDLYTSDEETLVMTLYDENNVLINQEYTSNKLTDNKDGTFSYTWLAPLNSGNHTIKFQTHNKKESIGKDDPSWSSLIPADFEIAKANKVKFSIINASDETCFEKSNGYINIKAEGEGERTFLYQLTKEEVVQFYNGTNWVDYSGTKADDETWFPFISKNNTKIGNLAKGNYRVKVKDSKGCFAR
ncbi:hypothetical protein [Tenacibaculum ovolyticum]|uniref:hypothetical protein n=1 Tax=Tenacibaculum ovolyticum TaxID=104270 RepID=UPI0003F7EBCC|nr:hypothetical protein [Tenacibaculum ovolyticum]